MARAQGKHREFGVNWSVATLFIAQTGFWQETPHILKKKFNGE